MEIIKYQFQHHGDARGQLAVLEEGKEFPFPAKRIYYIYGTQPGIARGFHAHKALDQVLICIHGSCKILLDNGREKTTVELNDPAEGLLVGHGVWHEMHDFTQDAILLVLASDFYQESDYIRDYDTFLAFMGVDKQ